MPAGLGVDGKIELTCGFCTMCIVLISTASMEHPLMHKPLRNCKSVPHTSAVVDGACAAEGVWGGCRGGG